MKKSHHVIEVLQKCSEIPGFKRKNLNFAAGQLNPIIFLPIESTPRELDYKLNIARLFCEQGFDAIIGNPPFIRDELKYKNYKGIFLEKGCNPDPEYYRRIIEKGIRVFCLSDEGAAEPAFSVTYAPAVETLKQTEKIFLWGEYQKNDLERRNSDPVLSSKYYVSGYPSFQFSLPHYRQYNALFRPKSLGKNYILINTNFASINGFSLEENMKACSAMSPETKAAIQLSYPIEEKALKSFLNSLEEIFLAFPDEDFLIRPHPAERQDTYNAFVQKYKNVRVSGKGNANQAISGAKLVIHKDCTTALQGYLSGLPVISLADPNEVIASTWAYDFGAHPANIHEAKELIKHVLITGHFDQSLKNIVDEKAQKALSLRFSHIETSTENVVSHMLQATRKLFDEMLPYRLTDSRTLWQKVKVMIRTLFPLHYKVPVASRPMFVRFTNKDIVDRLNCMNDLDSLSRKYQINELFPNAFYITRDLS